MNKYVEGETYRRWGYPVFFRKGEEALPEALKKVGHDVLPVVGGKISVMVLTSDHQSQKKIESLARGMNFPTEEIPPGGFKDVMANAI